MIIELLASSTLSFLSPARRSLNLGTKHWLSRSALNSHVDDVVGVELDDASSAATIIETKIVQDRIPCSIVGGYFYCGKTTFIRNALQNNESLHLGVIVSEMVH
jgi:hypothetical protein